MFLATPFISPQHLIETAPSNIELHIIICQQQPNYCSNDIPSKFPSIEFIILGYTSINTRFNPLFSDANST